MGIFIKDTIVLRKLVSVILKVQLTAVADVFPFRYTEWGIRVVKR